MEKPIDFILSINSLCSSVLPSGSDVKWVTICKIPTIISNVFAMFKSVIFFIAGILSLFSELTRIIEVYINQFGRYFLSDILRIFSMLVHCEKNRQVGTLARMKVCHQRSISNSNGTGRTWKRNKPLTNSRGMRPDVKLPKIKKVHCRAEMAFSEKTGKKVVFLVTFLLSCV
jgi:hypothetical protein